MKNIFFLLVVIVMINSGVQAQKKTFMRFYSDRGNKFEKGYFAGTTDSSIVVYKDTGKLEIPISKIGTIKTKRGLGHNILIIGSTGGVVLGIFGAATEKNNWEITFWQITKQPTLPASVVHTLKYFNG